MDIRQSLNLKEEKGKVVTSRKIQGLKGVSSELVATIQSCVELNPYFRLSAKELLKVPLVKDAGFKEIEGINEKEHRPTKISIEIDEMGYHGLGDNGMHDEDYVDLPMKQILDLLMAELNFPLLPED